MNFPTAHQLHEVKRLRDAGVVTVFRVELCKNCHREIPKGFVFCSRKCFAENFRKEISKALQKVRK